MILVARCGDFGPEADYPVLAKLEGERACPKAVIQVRKQNAACFSGHEFNIRIAVGI